MSKQTAGTKQKWDKSGKEQKITKIGELGILNYIFCIPDPLKSSLLPDINPWKLSVRKKLRPQVLKKL